MSSTVVTVHFPNGEREFRSTNEPAHPGDLMTCRGSDWIVTHVLEATDGSITITLAPKPHG